MKNSTSFDIIVIAMLREHERRQAIKTTLTKLGIGTFSFLDATDGTNESQYAAIRGYDKHKASAHKRELTPAEVACFDSHRRAWAYVAECNRPVLVLESDAEINRDTLSVCDSLCRKSDHDWGLVMLYYHECLPSFWGRQPIDFHYSLVRFANKHAYVASSFLLTPTAASELLEKGEEMWMPVDNFMTGGKVEKSYATYAVWPRCAKLHDLSEDSSIQGEREALVGRRIRKKRLQFQWLRNFWRKLRPSKEWM